MALRKKSKAKKKENLTLGQQIVSLLKTILSAIVIVMIINGIAIASFVVPTPSMENTVMAGDFLFVNKFIYGPSTPQVIPFLNIPLPYFKLPALKDPEKGDVIVFVFPGDRDELEARDFQYYLKRCVAVGGDTLKINQKKMYVNNKEYPLPEEGQFDERPGDRMAGFPIGKGFTLANYGPLVIPKEGSKIKLNNENYLQWEMFIRREGHEIMRNSNGVLIDGQLTDEYTVERDYVFAMGDNRDHSSDSRDWGFVPVDNIVGSPLMVYWSWCSPEGSDTRDCGSFFDKLSSIRWSRIFSFIN